MEIQSQEHDRKIKFIIREAAQEDYDQIDQLVRELVDQHAEAVPEIYQTFRRALHTPQYIARVISSRNRVIYVAEEDTRLIGCITVVLNRSRRQRPRAARQYAVVESLIVSEDVRRQGVGKALMAQAHQWAVENDAQQIELTVWEFNEDAQDFYKEIGYTTLRRRMWFNVKEQSEQ